MKISPSHPRAGIAIIIVMVSIFVLAVLAGGFASAMKVETRLAMNSSYETQLEWAGRSGVELARYVLAEELLVNGPGQRYDALDQKWAGGSADTNEVLLAIPTENIPLSPGVFIKRWVITDQERKFNINLALNNDEVITKALSLVGADAADSATILSSIRDWIDADSDTRINGAESDYYQSLSPPYFAKNAFIDDLSELLLVKGITPDIYWGGNYSNHPSAVLQARQVTRSGIQPITSSGTVGFADIFTPISSGLINILTASKEQLQVIPHVDETIASQIVDMRQQADNNGFLPFRQPGDLLVNTSLGRELTPLVLPYCTFRSSTFEAAIVVQVGQVTRTCFALLRRNGGQPSDPQFIVVLNMRWEEGDVAPAPAKPE